MIVTPEEDSIRFIPGVLDWIRKHTCIHTGIIVYQERNKNKNQEEEEQQLMSNYKGKYKHLNCRLSGGTLD